MPSGSSPTARALQALEVLRARPRTTAGQLGDHLGVSERAARRYVEILRQADIPVESSRGPSGGYRLGAGARLAPIVFTEEEALGLVMAVLDGHPAAAQSNDVAGSALSKVVRALPDRVGRQAAALREHAAAAPDRGAAHPDPTVTSMLVAAVAASRGVAITYRSSRENSWEEEVDPWAVVVRHARWYLLCHSHHAEAVRSYRLDRISSVAESARSFEPPVGLDPVATLEEHLGTGWEFPTRVVFKAPLDEVALFARPTMGRLESHSEGCVLVGSTSNPPMYAQEGLAAIPFAFRVEEGPELRAAVSALASRLTAALATPYERRAARVAEGSEALSEATRH